MKAHDFPSAQAKFDAEGSIEQFVIEVPTISPSVLGQAVKKRFEDTEGLEGIVVIDGDRPVGLIMRTAFFQKIGTIHGHSLFMKRPIDLIMDTGMMTIDVGENISQIGIRAMNRHQNKVYDYIIVSKNGRYIGVISIRLFLVDLANRNAAQINVLKEQQRELIAANEKEMMLVKDLEYKSSSIRNLLDNADQGFLFFEQDLTIKSEYSYKCIEIFSGGIGGKNFIDLITDYFEADRISVFRAAFDSYFANNSAVTDNVYLMLLPTDCVIGSKHINLSYRRIENDGKKAVMAVINDVTEKIELEQAMERDRIRQRMILKAISCQAQIKQMIDEFKELFTGGYHAYFSDTRPFSDSLNVLFREVHTFKGDFAQYGFVHAPETLHAFEDQLSTLVQRDDDVLMAEVEMVMQALNPAEVLSEDLGQIESVLGESYFGGSEIINVPRHKLDKALEAITRGGNTLSAQEAVTYIVGLKRKSLHDYLNQYRDYVQYLADKLMKAMPVYIVDGDTIEVDPDKYRAFIKSLIHIYRNIMDHGIESDEERLKAGKAQRGVITCETKRHEDTFSLSISDDGCGINISKLRKKALQDGLYPTDEVERMTNQQIADIIFSDNISTKDSATSLSGRGVGMAAFRDAAQKINGNVSLLTTQGQGTTFTVTFPL